MYCSSDAKSTARDAFPPGALVGDVSIRPTALGFKKNVICRELKKGVYVSLICWFIKDVVLRKPAGKRFSRNKSGSLNLSG
jgi:hypothetical protein